MGSNDLNYSLVSNKTVSQKIGSISLTPRARRPRT